MTDNTYLYPGEHRDEGQNVYMSKKHKGEGQNIAMSNEHRDELRNASVAKIILHRSFRQEYEGSEEAAGDRRSKRQSGMEHTHRCTNTHTHSATGTLSPPGAGKVLFSRELARHRNAFNLRPRKMRLQRGSLR